MLSLLKTGIEAVESLPTERTILGEGKFKDMIFELRDNRLNEWDHGTSCMGGGKPRWTTHKGLIPVSSQHASEFDPHNNLFEISIMSPSFQLRKVRAREVKKLTQSHTGL